MDKEETTVSRETEQEEQPESQRTKKKEMTMSRKYSQKKYHLPVIGHFGERSVQFKTILDAAEATGIHPTLIFEACIGKIFKAKNTHWEYVKGNHYIKYKAYYINAQESYTRVGGFNG